MRQKYNKFDLYRVDKNSIKLALELKKQLEPGSLREVRLRNDNPNFVPSNEKGLLIWVSAKYLRLPSDIGIKLLKKAYKTQYHVEMDHKICKYCGKVFAYRRDSALFCSNKCRQKFKRWGKKDVGDTLTQKSLSVKKPEISKTGVIPLIEHA